MTRLQNYSQHSYNSLVSRDSGDFSAPRASTEGVGKTDSSTSSAVSTGESPIVSVAGVLQSIRATSESALLKLSPKSTQSFRPDIIACYKQASSQERAEIRLALFERSRVTTKQRTIARKWALGLSPLTAIGLPLTVLWLKDSADKTRIKSFLKHILTDLARIDYDDGAMQSLTGICREAITYKDLFEYKWGKQKRH